MEYSVPEKIIVRQGDKENKDVFFAGAGKTIVSRMFNQKYDLYFGEVDSGQMLNEKSALFNSSSEYTLKSKSYCQLGVILFNDFQDMCASYKDIKEKLTKMVIRNPFNIEQQYFVEVCRNRIPFLKEQSDYTLRCLFYSSNLEMFEMEETIFTYGTKCKCIYIVMSGVV